MSQPSALGATSSPFEQHDSSLLSLAVLLLTSAPILAVGLAGGQREEGESLADILLEAERVRTSHYDE